MKQRLLSGVDRPSERKRIKRPNLNTLFSVAVRKDKILRNRTIERAYHEFAYTMAEIADAAKIHFSTVSKVIKMAEQALAG